MAFLPMFIVKRHCIRRANPPISLHAPGSLRSLPAKQSGAAYGLGTPFLDRWSCGFRSAEVPGWPVAEGAGLEDVEVVACSRENAGNLLAPKINGEADDAE